MGERALVAYERPDGRYDLHRSQWGATDFALADLLGPETPYGGTPPLVDPDPAATAVPRDALVGRVDFLLYEAVYVVATDWTTTAYLPCWLGGLDDPRDPVGDGLLLAVGARPTYDRGWYRGTRDVVADLLAAGTWTRSAARDYLAARIREWAGERVVLE